MPEVYDRHEVLARKVVDRMWLNTVSEMARRCLCHNVALTLYPPTGNTVYDVAKLIAEEFPLDRDERTPCL